MLIESPVTNPIAIHAERIYAAIDAQRDLLYKEFGRLLIIELMAELGGEDEAARTRCTDLLPSLGLPDIKFIGTENPLGGLMKKS